MDPASYGLVGPVEVIETHISRIFLADERALKMKRAVRLPYVDFSTPALRLAACRKEVELNASTAPGLYLGVRRITREPDDRLVFDGTGELVDAVVEMVRFDQERLFDRMAAAGTLTPQLMTRTARMIAHFHRGAPVVHAGSGAENIASVLDVNDAGFATSRLFDKTELQPFSAACHLFLERYADVLDRREAAGKVRRCHGDLHLRNICLLDGEPRLFDCIEFNDRIATIDTLYDLAFLLMDLWHRRLPDFANLVANRYLDEADDEDGFVLLPFFMAVRAAVRAHVTATQAQESGDSTEELATQARSYFCLACSLLEPRAARLVAIGGLSGSGKTTVAEALAAHLGAPPGARIIESDRIRKAMHGVPAETRLPEKAYRPEVSAKVYGEMARRTSLILKEGGTVVADAVFDHKPDRDLIEKAARDAASPFLGVWLHADPLLLWQRVAARQGGPSDATVDVLSRQLQRRAEEPGWHRIDVEAAPTEISSSILALIGE
nr:bifunctional aminoglycoside phosphotransferase/ATP-binding protein [Mesorhizobium soli]